MIGEPGKNGMQILLAHNPKYGNAYFDWGADMILCGHYHGELSGSVNIMVCPVRSIWYCHLSAVVIFTEESSICSSVQGWENIQYHCGFIIQENFL